MIERPFHQPSTGPSTPRERLSELIELAQSYRQWNRKTLGQALGRDPSKLVPASGIPKLDVVVGLARVLEWPVEQVVRVLAGTAIDDTETDDDEEEEDDDAHPVRASFDELDHRARSAHLGGAYRAMISLARRAYRQAASDEERVRASNREACGWDGLGRYAVAMDTIRRGLRSGDGDIEPTLVLQANLATTHYSLGQLVEGRGVASDIIDYFDDNPARSVPGAVADATAHFARGHCYRRHIGEAGDDRRRRELAKRARSDLEHAQCLFERLADRAGFNYADMAATCHGGVMEAEVTLGTRDVDETLAVFNGALDALIDPETMPVGNSLERHGWWCLFACNIVLRHVTNLERRENLLAVFTNKADEIGERLGNWAIRERVLQLEFAHHPSVGAGIPVAAMPTAIDRDDMRRIAGVIGRFPSFAALGWQILRGAELIDGE